MLDLAGAGHAEPLLDPFVCLLLRHGYLVRYIETSAVGGLCSGHALGDRGGNPRRVVGRKTESAIIGLFRRGGRGEIPRF